jgi:hypothetical protein
MPVERFYCKGDRVLILPGPASSNLTWGSVGVLLPQEPEDGYYAVQLEGGRWAGKTVHVQRNQLCGINEAIGAVLTVRDQEEKSAPEPGSVLAQHLKRLRETNG